MGDPMISADTLAAICWAVAITCIGLPILAAIVGAVLCWADLEVERHVQAALSEQAADHGEPTRAEVEAEWDEWCDQRPVYGPLAMHGPKDVVDARAMPISQSETAQRIRALIARNEAARIDDEWAAWRGEAS